MSTRRFNPWMLGLAVGLLSVSLAGGGAAAVEQDPIPMIRECELPLVIDPTTFEPIVENVTYNVTPAGESLLLDIVVPKGEAPAEGRPLVIVLHGGGFLTGDKSEGSQGFPQRLAIQQLAQSGFVAVSANYRLSAPENGEYHNIFPAAVQDSRCLVRWARRHATEYGIDPTRIAITGVSAGGTLASSVAVMDDDTMLNGVSLDEADGYTCQADEGGKLSSTVNRAVVYYGPEDFTIPLRRWKKTAPAIISYLGGHPRKVPVQAHDASPVSYVDENDPPTLLLHGLQDDIVPHSQSVLMLKALNEADVRSRLINLPLAGHSFLMFHEDYFRLPDGRDDLSRIPPCSDDIPKGHKCQFESEDEGTVIRVVGAVEKASCTSLNFLNEMLKNP